jgi:hypothetical protein
MRAGDAVRTAQTDAARRAGQPGLWGGRRAATTRRGAFGGSAALVGAAAALAVACAPGASGGPEAGPPRPASPGPVTVRFMHVYLLRDTMAKAEGRGRWPVFGEPPAAC